MLIVWFRFDTFDEKFLGPTPTEKFLAYSLTSVPDLLNIVIKGVYEKFVEPWPSKAYLPLPYTTAVKL